MRTWVAVASFFLLAAGVVSAQRHKLTINAETPEGQMLQQIGQEADEAKKLAMMEQFAEKYPKHEGAAWVYAQMVPTYTKAGQFDKAMAAGEKLLALDPEDVELAHATLKAAEAKKDPDAVKKWALLTSDVARKVAQSPKPSDEDEAEQWKQHVELAKQIEVYTEYSLYAAALQTSDARKKIELAEALRQRNPQSQYLPQFDNQLFLAYQQIGDNDNAARVAERVLEKDQSSPEMLLVAANYAFFKEKQAPKALTYTGKLVEVLNARPKPEGVSDADWEKHKSSMLGRTHWLTGMVLMSQNKFADAEKALREALPNIKGEDSLMAPALFNLGLANYKLGEAGSNSDRILEALRFFEQCAAMKSALQGQARNNIKAIRSRYVVK